MILAFFGVSSQLGSSQLVIAAILLIVLAYVATLYRPQPVNGMSRSTEFRISKWFKAVLRDEPKP